MLLSAEIRDKKDLLWASESLVKVGKNSGFLTWFMRIELNSN